MERGNPMTTPLQTVLDKLPHAKEEGDGWRAKCPGHSGKSDDSLSITEKNGTVLLKCFSGCEFIAIVNALELKPADLFTDNGSKGKSKSKIVATYDYTDESGKLLYQAVRKEPKAFTQRRPDGNGGWEWKRGKRLVLYRLPELLATDKADRVFLVEGEKSADALARLGVCSTTSAMGAEAWNRGKDEYVETLAGRRVCILPDNDGAGKKYAEAAARSLQDVADVLILNLPGLLPAQDPFDWIANGGNRDTLLRLVKTDAQPYEQDNSDDFLLSASADDEGNALCVNLLHGEKVAYCDAYGWMVYNGRYWECEGAEGELGHFIVETLVRRRLLGVQFDREGIVRVSRGNANRLRSCRYMLEKHRTVKVSDLDQSPDLLNCNNGVVDLRTGEIEPHDPKQLFTYCIPVNYNPDGDLAEWLDFLAGVAESQETIDYLQLALGYSLTGHTWDEVLFYIQGPTRSGKGTLTETFLAVLGRLPLGTEADFSTFTSKRDGDTQNFDLAGLKPCRFVSASESSKYERLNSAKVKSATGGNDIRCAHKGKDLFSYKPQFKIWLSSNFPPRADVDDDAVWARLRVIRFPNSFLGKEDKQLKRKLREPRNLEAVLAWSVAGARKWYDSPEKGLPIPASIEAATKEARDSFDYVSQWVRESIAVTGISNNFIPNPSLYASYKEWCDANGVMPKKIGGLTSALKSKGLSAGTQKKHKGKNVRGLVGACFRADAHQEKEIPLNFVEEDEIPF